MAGGSADAAATLRLLARLRQRGQTPLAHDELRGIGATLGADVPAQVAPGRYLATGAGERVEALAPAWPGYAILVLPAEGALSTPAVYREFDRLGLQRSAEDLAAQLDAVRAATARRGGGLPRELMANDLEPAALSLMPSIAPVLERVAGVGADRAMVSGSGPTVLGFFTDRTVARTAAQALRREHPRLVLTEPTHLA